MGASTLPYLFLPSSNLYTEAGTRVDNPPEKTRSKDVDYEDSPTLSNLQFPSVTYVELPDISLSFSNGAHSYVYIPNSEHDSTTLATCPHLVH